MSGYARRVALRVKIAKTAAEKQNADLSEAMGMGPGAVTDRFAGRREFSLTELEQIAPVLGVSINALTQDPTE